MSADVTMATTATASATPSREGSRRRAPGVVLVVTGLVALLAVAPLLGVASIAMRGGAEAWPHLVSVVLPEALVDTGLLLLGVGFVVTILGVPTAWLVATCRFPGRRLFETALILPLAVPTYIVAYSYVEILDVLGPVQTAWRAALGITSPRASGFPEIRSLGGAVLVMGFVLYPYVYLTARAVFAMQSGGMIEAARTLGASRTRAFVTVALPLARPALAIGLALALMETLNDIGASEHLGVRSLTVAIYTTWLNRGSLAGAAQIACVMLAIVLLLLALERRARKAQRFTTGRAGRVLPPSPLTGWSAFGAVVACTIPVLFGFVIPAAFLADEAVRQIVRTGIEADFLSLVGRSVSLAAITAAVTVSIGVGLAYALVRTRDRRAHGLARTAGLGYAIPGSVLALGVLIPLAAFDNAVDAVMRREFGIATGLLLSGTGIALVYAYCVRFLVVASGSIEAGLAKLSPHLDLAARTLGRSPLQSVAAVELPLLRPALAAAALLVFVDTMKELPATLLLRPFDFETLATSVYGHAARGAFEDGAVAALAIVIVGLLPVALIARLGLGDSGGSRSARTA